MSTFSARSTHHAHHDHPRVVVAAAVLLVLDGLRNVSLFGAVAAGVDIPAPVIIGQTTVGVIELAVAVGVGGCTGGLAPPPSSLRHCPWRSRGDGRRHRPEQRREVPRRHRGGGCVSASSQSRSTPTPVAPTPERGPTNVPGPGTPCSGTRPRHGCRVRRAPNINRTERTCYVRLSDGCRTPTRDV